MINYESFAAIAFLIKNGDPDLIYDHTTVEESSCNAEWKHHLDECSKLKADYYYSKDNIIINVEYNELSRSYYIRYQGVSARKAKGLAFLKKYKAADSILAKAMYDVFMEYETAQLYPILQIPYPCYP